MWRSRRPARWLSSRVLPGRVGWSRSRRLRRPTIENRKRRPRWAPFLPCRAGSGRLGLEMAEHDAARLVVHFGLEGELVLQRNRAGRGRPCRDLIDQPFHVGKSGIDFFAEHVRRQARPAPERHIDDGVGITNHIAALGEMIVENAVMTLRFELVTVVGIFEALSEISWRMVLEMHRLSRIGTDAGGNEHQP